MTVPFESKSKIGEICTGSMAISKYHVPVQFFSVVPCTNRSREAGEEFLMTRRQRSNDHIARPPKRYVLILQQNNTTTRIPRSEKF